MSKVQFVVNKVEPVKSGVGKYGPWTLYRITTEQGQQITTFNEEWLGKVGQAVVAEVEEQPSNKLDREGKPYKNLVIVEEKKREYQPKSRDTEILAKLDEILEILHDISLPEEKVQKDELPPF